MFLCQLPLLCI
ncbi:hypothetical protein LSH36_13g08054 [Paralvinella palmiformis]|uniref:Uncharacterized protein n=1 Tax=Paralvinella palmiformis TaxID=53620 RepID=A0AAD9NHM5_9ANNE|nr:hypothetical protein LSH36_13g08054 [Paralvinella palmiformis]